MSDCKVVEADYKPGELVWITTWTKTCKCCKEREFMAPHECEILIKHGRFFHQILITEDYTQPVANRFIFKTESEAQRALKLPEGKESPVLCAKCRNYVEGYEKKIISRLEVLQAVELVQSNSQQSLGAYLGTVKALGLEKSLEAIGHALNFRWVKHPPSLGEMLEKIKTLKIMADTGNNAHSELYKSLEIASDRLAEADMVCPKYFKTGFCEKEDRDECCHFTAQECWLKYLIEMGQVKEL